MAPLRIEGDKAEPRKPEQRMSRASREFFAQAAARAVEFRRHQAAQRARIGFAPGSLRLLGAERQPDGSNVVRFETVPCPPAGW